MTEKGTSQLSRLCAVFIVLCHALEILVRKIEALALRERLYMARENKQAVTGIIQACRKIEFHMDHISDWALGAAVTDKGECGTTGAYDVLQQDASDVCELILWWTNASHADDAAREWTGKPYCSKQRVICNLTASDGIGLQKLTFDKDRDGVASLNLYNVDGCFPGMRLLAHNDGLSVEDWKAWFRSYDLTKPMAIIHFTNFRY